MAYASSHITGSYLGNLVAEAYALIFRKWSRGQESETDIRNASPCLISLEVPCWPCFRSLCYSFPVSYNKQILCEVCVAPFGFPLWGKALVISDRKPLSALAALHHFTCLSSSWPPLQKRGDKNCFMITGLERMLCNKSPLSSSVPQGPDCPLTDVFPLKSSSGGSAESLGEQMWCVL